MVTGPVQDYMGGYITKVLYRDNGKKVETSTFFWVLYGGYIGTMENKMEASI